MAEPLAPPAAWLWCINSCPPPGNLFAMGSLRALSKGFIKFRSPATKIIYLVNRMIYFSFLPPPPSLIVPTRLNHTFLSHPTGRTSSRLLPLSCARVFGWLLCMFNSVGSHLRPRRVLFSIFYSISIQRPGTKRKHPPTRSTLATSLLQLPLQRRRQPIFDCCVPQLNSGHLRPGVRQSLYFLLLHLPPQTMGNRPTHTLRSSRVPSPTPFPTSTPITI
jgi:hypothetical protein